MKRLFILSILAFFVSSATAVAQEVEVLKILTANKIFKKSEVKATAQAFYLSENFVKINIKSENSDRTVMFDSENEIIYMIDHKEKNYLRFTKSELEEIKEQLAPMRAMMQAMKGEKKERKVIDTGENEDIEGWKTKKYKVQEEDKTVAEKWIGDLDLLKISKEKLAGIDKMKTFVAIFDEDMAEEFTISSPDEGLPYTGVPVFAISYNDGEKTLEERIKKIENKTLKASIFDLPEGYEQTSFELSFGY